MRSKLLYCIALALALAVSLLPGLKASAQSNGLGITPKLTYSLGAGKQLSDTLYVNNLSNSQPLNLKLDVVDFEPQDETGTPKLLQASNQPLTPWSLKPYVTLPDFVTIPAAQSKLIPFTIKLPSNIGAGSYYSAVEYTASSGNSQEQVNIAASSATLVFVNVPGDATELLNIAQFGVYDNGKFKSVFSKSPSTFAYRVKNSGNISESPAGSIVVKNIFGHVVASIDNANPLNNLVLIGQTRRFQTCYPKSTNQSDLGKDGNCQPLKITPGRYTAEIELLYGQNGRPSRQISATAVFWYLPLWFVLAVAIVLLALAYVVYRLYKRFTSPHHRHRH